MKQIPSKRGWINDIPANNLEQQPEFHYGTQKTLEVQPPFFNMLVYEPPFFYGKGLSSSKRNH